MSLLRNGAVLLVQLTERRGHGAVFEERITAEQARGHGDVGQVSGATDLPTDSR
jgi:hypothetical protein